MPDGVEVEEGVAEPKSSSEPRSIERLERRVTARLSLGVETLLDSTCTYLTLKLETYILKIN